MKKIFVSMILILCMFAASASAGVMIISSTNAYDNTEAMYANIDRAIALLNGKVIESGKLFSFNEAVGPRTAENGFVVAPNSNGYPVMGGGVSQIASTLHLALTKMGNEITYKERHCFGTAFKGGYVEAADESVLTDYSRRLDYSFTSSHAEDLSISMWRSDSMIFCQLTGVTDEPIVPEATAVPADPTLEPDEKPVESKKQLYKVVNVNVCVNLRERASTSAFILAKVPKNAVVEYTGEKEGSFLKVIYKEHTGYVHGDYLAETGNEPAKLKVVNCNYSVSFRTEPSKSAAKLGDVPLGTELEYTGEQANSFMKVIWQGKEGYVSADYLAEVN